jgi:hypothetical protein
MQYASQKHRLLARIAESVSLRMFHPMFSASVTAIERTSTENIFSVLYSAGIRVRSQLRSSEA